MKLKSAKEKDGILSTFKDIYSNCSPIGETALSIDTDGCVTVDSFKKLVDYRKGVVILETKTRFMYIYGQNLVIVSCGKNSAVCKGDISKVELFAKEG